MDDENDGDGIDTIAVQAGDEVVVRTSNEGCESCGSDAYGVLVPLKEDLPSAFDDGVVVCEECYEENDHYDTDEKYGFKEFNQ